MTIKKSHIFIIFFLFIGLLSFGQKNKYKRSYPLKPNEFHHSVYYKSGNAIIYVDRDSLISRYLDVILNSEYYDSSKEKIKVMVDFLQAQQSNSTDITKLVVEPDVVNITFSYFAECITSKRINIIDVRTNKAVKKIVVKKSQSRNSHSHSWYYYFIPDDREEFMHRVDRATSKVKFL